MKLKVGDLVNVYSDIGHNKYRFSGKIEAVYATSVKICGVAGLIPLRMVELKR